MSLFELISKREAFAEKKHRALMRRVKALQAGLYASLLDSIIVELQTDGDGRIKFTSDNIRRAARASTIWAAYRKQTGGLTDFIVKSLLSLFNLNTLYMREVATVSDSLESRARKLLLRNLGYDLDKKEVIKDSWLSSLTSQEEVKQRIVNRINAALQANTSLEQFRKEFRDDFLDTKSGLGYASRFFNQRTFDLFQQFDRSTQEVYRQNLKLNHALYSGTLMKPTKKTKGTRPFCWQRVNNLYDLDTINGWNALNWSGKIPTGDVKVNVGGYQCRHHLSWVSDEVAAKMQANGRVLNRLNPPKPE